MLWRDRVGGFSKTYFEMTEQIKREKKEDRRKRKFSL